MTAGMHLFLLPLTRFVMNALAHGRAWIGRRTIVAQGRISLTPCARSSLRGPDWKGAEPVGFPEIIVDNYFVVCKLRRHKYHY